MRLTSARPRTATVMQNLVAGVTVTLIGTVAFAAPAAAGDGPRNSRPHVLPPSCAAAGGTFSVQAGSRSCTTVTTETVKGPVVTASTSFSTGPGRGCSSALPPEVCEAMTLNYRYVGTSQQLEVVETTTTSSQRGNETVTETTDERVLSSEVVPLTCAYGERYGSEPTDEDTTLISDLQPCHRFGLFTA